MSVKNFVQCGLVTPVAANTVELVLVAPTAAYQYPPLDGGTLVIADSVARPTFYEIISYTHRIDNVLYGVVRAKEGTTARSWTGVAWVYQALTAQDYVEALALKAALESPALTGIPTAPTAALGTNTNQIATMAALKQAIDALVGGAPGALDALNEFAAALGNDPNFATTMTNALAGKEPSIAAGTSAQMWLGNKTWASVLGQVQNTLLTGLGVGSDATIVSTDTLIAALAKIQNQLNNKVASTDTRLTNAREWTATDVTQAEAEAGSVTVARKWSPLRVWQAVLGSKLTGINLTLGTAVSATDTVLIALGKLQKQITDAATNLAGNVRNTAITGYVVGSNAALAATDTVLGALGKIQGQLNGKQASLGYTAENLANKGVANGYAGLDATGKVPAVQLPSFVDDVLEFTNLAGFPATGETGKIYVDLATNKSHRWSGSAYVEISASPGSTDAVTEGSGNLYFTEGRVRATLLAGYAVGANAVLAAGDTVLAAFGKLQAQITGLATSKLDATANAVSASKLQTARTIGGVAFDGTANINLPGVNAAGNQNTSGNAGTATKLATGRTIGMTGDVTWTSPAFDGSGNVTAAATLANSGVTAGTYGKVTVNAKGLVTAGAALAAEDIPALDAGKITTGVFAAARIPTLNQNTTGNAATATKLQTPRTIGGVSFDGSANINLPGVNAAGNQNTTGSAATLTTARTLTIGNTGKTFNGSANVAWTLVEIGAVTSNVDTTPGRLLTTDYLGIGKLDKTLWPKATSLLTLKNGPDRTVWVETDTVDAPHSGFYGSVSSKRLSSTTVIFEAKSLFEAARYTYTFTPLGDSGWVKETMHEVGDWVDLRPNLLAPYFWKSARDGNNHFPQIRLVDRNTVELRGIVSYNASAAAPPNGVAFRVPEGFRPQMASAGICFADSSSPLWFGQTPYLIQGQVNYSSDPGWANGNVRLLLLSAPNPVADGAVDLSGIRYYLS